MPMQLNDRILCLKQIDLFSSFTEEEIGQFAAKIEEVRAKSGDVLFREGEPGQDMFILIEGALRVYKESRFIAAITPVDYVGEMAIIEEKPRSATVQATAPSLLLKVTSAQFQDYLAGQPQSLVSMMKLLSQRIRRDTEMLAEEFEKANILIHDMKNILSTFLYLQPLKKLCSENPQAVRNIELMQQSSRNLAALMDEALANAKRLQRPYRLTSGSLADLIVSLAEGELAVHPDLAGKEIRVRLKEELPEFPFCQLDIRRVLTNLVLNSAQASPPGGVIAIELGREGDDAVILVRDQGSGIPAELLDKVFLPHFTTREEGTGLGLASCRQIVEERHGGTIGVVSTSEQGTAFRFTLPLNPSSEPVPLTVPDIP